MQSITEITRIAARHKGGAAALERLLSRPLPPGKIRKIPNDRWLSAMTKCIFQAGFNWQIIENKWERFEEVFEGFDVGRWMMMSDDDLDQLLKIDGIVRNVVKIRSVRENATFLKEVGDAHGSSVGDYFAAWKPTDYCNNLRELQKNGARLGGKTSQIFLQRMGIDAIAFTPDVIKALQREDIINRILGSNRDWTALQTAIDTWRNQSDRTLTEISQILVFSVD
ncbi:MAG: DNA-3-methyladenine glycosylase I [Gammaproteobacteria bacterium]|nr:DNA-3-methyladenine glycosylase I [Gammaproteobacteria bacterium]